MGRGGASEINIDGSLTTMDVAGKSGTEDRGGRARNLNEDVKDKFRLKGNIPR